MTKSQKNNALAELISKNNARRKSGDMLDKRAVEVKSIDAENHRIDAVVSTASQDRDGDVILPSAFKKSMPGFMKNPVILACHQHDLATGCSPVVGVVVDYKIDKNALHVTIEFETETNLGREYWTLYSNKRMRAFSVGFIPLKWKDEGRSRVYTEAELLEISCVAVPSNRDALSKSAQKKADWLARKKDQKTDSRSAEFAKAFLDGPEDEKAAANCPLPKPSRPKTIKDVLAQKHVKRAKYFGSFELYKRFCEFEEKRKVGHKVSQFKSEEIELFDKIIENGVETILGSKKSKLADMVGPGRKEKNSLVDLVCS